jgi:hypothetical protein
LTTMSYLGPGGGDSSCTLEDTQEAVGGFPTFRGTRFSGIQLAGRMVVEVATHTFDA